MQQKKQQQQQQEEHKQMCQTVAKAVGGGVRVSQSLY